MKSFMKDTLTSLASQQKDSHSLYLVCGKLRYNKSGLEQVAV